MKNRLLSHTAPRLALAAGLAVVAGAMFTSFVNGPTRSSASPDPFAALPSTLKLNAVVRDFRAAEEEGGHPDFQAYAGKVHIGLVSMHLDGEGKPVVESLHGFELLSDWKDNKGHKIPWMLYDPDKGDSVGSAPSFAVGEAKQRIASPEAFEQWYRDVPGVNLSKVIPVILKRQPGTNVYVFDSDQDEPYKSNGGFFPIDDDLFGNYQAHGNGMHNFHFTTEIDTVFTYQKGQGHLFTFTGDDDVWVFINGQLVLDLGGVHPKAEQTLELDRLDWLDDGQECTLKVFHAERRVVQSNFRMETTLVLRSAKLPETDWTYD